ncbi:MAG TPA: hypothetical protein VFZ66_19650 [Herpetosiphonaceae bacterium]
MIRGAQRARWLGIILLALLLTACSAPAGLINTPPTVYDLVQRPQEFAGKDVTAQGFYLWKPGDPATSVLLPGVSTADRSTQDAQPIYASVQCGSTGECQPSTTAVGEPSTGAIWLENFPAAVTADLHRPGDSVWGVVEVTGLFEANGGYGPGGAYKYRLQVKEARSLQEIERVVAEVKDEPLGEGRVSIFALSADPATYSGQRVTSRGYYFWSPATQGMFVQKVESEKTPDGSAGGAPMPGGITMGLDGFPPEKSGQLNIGPNNTFVWGLVEVTGTFQTGDFGPDGRYKQQIKVESVEVLEQPKQ